MYIISDNKDMMTMMMLKNKNHIFEEMPGYKNRAVLSLQNILQLVLQTQWEVIKEEANACATVLRKVSKEVTRKTQKLANSEKCLRLVHCVLLGIICTLVYGNSLHGDFVHDDISAIVTNDDALGKTNIFQVFCNDFWGMKIWDRRSHKSYRPVTILTFRYVTKYIFI